MVHLQIWMLMMIKLFLVGIGTGNPAHVTIQAINQLKAADIIMIPRKGEHKSDLVDLRHQICDELLGEDAPPLIEFDLPVRDDNKSYLTAVDEWHDAIAEIWQDCIQAARKTITTNITHVAMLIWGDPALYDSSLRIASRLTPAPIITIIPGITSVQALTAAHKIPLNEIGKPFIITTGRQLTSNGFPKEVDTAIIMLDGKCAFQSLEQDLYHIWWGAYLGMKSEVIIDGQLSKVADRIIQTRQQERAKHGWIMDSYMLRREKTRKKLGKRTVLHKHEK